MTVKRVTSTSELQAIKALQNQNLRKNLTAAEAEKEGFVTAEYTLDFLQRMHEVEPSIIAMDDGEVVGYAIVTTKKVRGEHDLLDDLFNQIDRHYYNGEKLSEVEYVLIGQLCVAKSHRGRGIVQSMYDFYRKELSPLYKYCATDVDERNPRSVKAHLKSGFEILGTIKYGGSSWHIVIWDWRGNN